jgi:hypothetical protein
LLYRNAIQVIQGESDLAIHHDDIERISEEIRMYLRRHPNAADTLEGIVKWWLAQMRFEEAATIVEKALERLIASGEVVQSTNADNQRIYRCPKQQPNQETH